MSNSEGLMWMYRAGYVNFEGSDVDAPLLCIDIVIFCDDSGSMVRAYPFPSPFILTRSLRIDCC